MSSRLSHLDGLRALAALAVVTFHGHVYPGGFIGVDCFFVLSGFLITGLLLDEQARSGRISLAHFWLRRTLRLLPAMVAYLIGTFVLIVLARPTEAVVSAPRYLAALLGVHNWLPTGAPDTVGSFNDHLWSLSVEQQFYLIWPLVLLVVLARRRSSSRLWVWVAIAAVTVTVWRAALFMLGVGAHRLYTGTDTRADGLLIGCALAMLWRRTGFAMVPDRVWTPLSWFGWAGLCVALVIARPDAAPMFLGGGTVVALLAGIVVAAAVAAPHRGPSRILGLAPLVWLGSISYAFYLWEAPFIDLALLKLAPRIGSLAALLLAVALSLVVAVLSRRLIEVPAQRLRPRAEAALARLQPRLRGRRRRAEWPGESVPARPATP